MIQAAQWVKKPIPESAKMLLAGMSKSGRKDTGYG
jgi:hypothetical protein